LARALKTFTILLPMGAAVGLSTFVGPSLARPAGLLGDVIWIVQLTALSTATVIVVDRFARRLVPLAGLLNLSLVFPDEAPSRFGLALKSGSTKRLRAELDDRPTDETVNQAATRLLSMVSDLNQHDRLTRGHTERVRAYSDLIAEEMGLDGDDRWRLRWAVLLHDIGKLTVPPEILNKAGKPDDAEWATLRGHPAAGAAMVQPLADWLGEWRRAAGEHHERWDGTGYPNGLAGEQISLAGRIVAVADAYDVITSARSYKRPTDPAVARQELVRCAGSQFDPAVVRAFVNVSLGKLRLVGGPLAWLASLPALGNVPGTIVAAATNAAVAASVVAASVVGGVAAMPSSAQNQLVESAAASVSPGGARTHWTSGHGGAGRSDGGGGGSTSSSDSGSSGGGRSNGEHTSSGPEAQRTDAVDGHGADSVTDGTSRGGPESSTASAADDSTTSTTLSGGSTVGGSSGDADETTGGAPTGGGSSSVTTTTVHHSPVATTTTSPATTTSRPATTTTRPVTTTTAGVGPTVNADSATVVNYTQTDIPVLPNDVAGTAPIDPTTLTITVAPGKANNYNINSDHTIRYRSKFLTLAGTDSLQYRICDTAGRCGTATLTITINLI
jgi:hypothetical protein